MTESESTTGTKPARPSLFCRCSKTCGSNGAWISQSTYYRHNPKLRPNIASTSSQTAAGISGTPSTSRQQNFSHTTDPHVDLDSDMDIDPPARAASLLANENPLDPGGHRSDFQPPAAANIDPSASPDEDEDEDEDMRSSRAPSPTDDPLEGASHYYPARFRPDLYFVEGCDHDDVNLGELLDNFDSEEAAERYHANVKFVSESKNQTQYKERRLETGICKPTIFSGLPRNHRLGVPDCFAMDAMHAPCINLPDLMIPLWRGTFDCDKTDDRATWDWAVLTGDTWKRHGKAVADLTQYIPGSFDRPPRNPAEKINSGYKAWEFNLYFFGIGPALLYGILPEKYYRNYCKAVRSIRILLQEEATPDEILEAHRLYSEFSDEFEQLYIQGRADRLHFARPVLHTISHMPGETVNALTAIIPDLEPESNKLPRGAVDVGGGYVLLRAQDSCSRPVRGCEEAAIREYLRDEFGDGIAEEWQPSVVRLRAARHVKVQTTDYDDPELAEVLFFLILDVEGEERYLAVASFFGPPEPHLFDISSKCFWSVNHLRESDIRVIDVTSILSCVTMAPDHQYQLYRQDGSEIDRWHLMEKPRLKLASWSGRTENMEED
ncbi:hypothetical protein C8R47DRAFT_1297643 [Mycena vitilis]|nr:hypothetical protein C8R47DRAFT_1297643 [Mycena vitilis]